MTASEKSVGRGSAAVWIFSFCARDVDSALGSTGCFSPHIHVVHSKAVRCYFIKESVGSTQAKSIYCPSRLVTNLYIVKEERLFNHLSFCRQLTSGQTALVVTMFVFGVLLEIECGEIKIDNG